jgi:hypothetical protein
MTSSDNTFDIDNSPVVYSQLYAGEEVGKLLDYRSIVTCLSVVCAGYWYYYRRAPTMIPTMPAGMNEIQLSREHHTTSKAKSCTNRLD